MALSINVPFPPIFLNRPAITTRDPHGLLPLLRRIRAEGKKLVLHWDVDEQRLAIWHWPVKDGQRVPPSELNHLRITHDFRGPCCLCSTQELDYCEAAMFMVTSGHLAGEYVAACAKGNCHYWVFLERLYPRRGLPIRAYNLRVGIPPPEVRYSPPRHSGDENSPPPASQPRLPNRQEDRPSDDAAEERDVAQALVALRSTDRPNRPAKRARQGQAVSGLDLAARIRETAPPPRRKPATPFCALMQLDSIRHGGLTPAQFNDLFIQCSSCRIIATKHAFTGHICDPNTIRHSIISQRTVVIDLTNED